TLHPRDLLKQPGRALRPMTSSKPLKPGIRVRTTRNITDIADLAALDDADDVAEKAHIRQERVSRQIRRINRREFRNSRQRDFSRTHSDSIPTPFWPDIRCSRCFLHDQIIAEPTDIPTDRTPGHTTLLCITHISP